MPNRNHNLPSIHELRPRNRRTSQPLSRRQLLQRPIKQQPRNRRYHLRSSPGLQSQKRHRKLHPPNHRRRHDNLPPHLHLLRHFGRTNRLLHPTRNHLLDRLRRTRLHRNNRPKTWRRILPIPPSRSNRHLRLHSRVQRQRNLQPKFHLNL